MIHRIINLTDALDALAHDAIAHAHHYDRKTDVRNETLREWTRKEGAYGIQQNGMGHEGERQQDAHKKTSSKSIRRKAVRWRYWVWSKWSTLLSLTTPILMLMSTSHTSQAEVRWSTKWPVNQRMPSGLVSEWVNDSGIAAVSSHETRTTPTSAIPNVNAR